MTLLIDKPLDELLTERIRLRRRLAMLDDSIEAIRARQQQQLLDRMSDGDHADGWEGAFDGHLQDARRQ